jgi:C-terminal processing protease CtpA/Prc
MRFTTFCLSIVALILVAPANAIEARLELPVTLSQKQAREEIDLVARILTRMHPGVYQYQSKKEFERLVGQTRKSITGPVNAAQIYLDLARIVASVCDSHTQIHYIAKQAGLIDPARFRVFGADLVMIGDTLRAVSKYDGRPIAEIAGIEAADLIEAVRERTAVDACGNENIVFDSLEAGAIATAILGEGPSYAVRFADARKPDVVQLGSNAFIGFVMGNQVRQYLGTHPLELEKRGFDSCQRFETDFLCRRSSASISYLRFLSFDYDDADATIDSIFKTILKNADDDLIIDLQDNPGGNIRTMGYFLSYLLARSHRIAEQAHRRSLKVEAPEFYTWDEAAQEKTFNRDGKTFRRAGRRHGVYTLQIRKHAFGHPHFRGRITVLVNPGTVSAGVAAAAILRRQRKAEIIGLPPSGSGEYSCAAAFGDYVLPHSRLVLKVPADCFSSRKAYINGSRRLKPDVIVPVTTGNMNRHPQAVLDAALAHLGKAPPVKEKRIAFLVRNNHVAKTVADLDGSDLCFVGSSDVEETLRAYSRSNGITFNDVSVVDDQILESFYYMGRCDAAAAEESVIKEIERSTTSRRKSFILPDTIEASGG